MANERARLLRKDMSDAEWKLWQRLRGGEIGGFRFRRQHPIGAYIADFICLEKRLIIEVDGAQHAEQSQMDHDAKRTRWLNSEWYTVKRFWTNEVMTELDSVLDSILMTLEALPTARKRPQSRRRHKDTE
jgi:very-short-patch-repair endonuclease